MVSEQTAGCSPETTYSAPLRTAPAATGAALEVLLLAGSVSKSSTQPGPRAHGPDAGCSALRCSTHLHGGGGSEWRGQWPLREGHICAAQQLLLPAKQNRSRQQPLQPSLGGRREGTRVTGLFWLNRSHVSAPRPHRAPHGGAA